MLEVAREVAAEVRGPDTVRTLLPPAWAVLERVLDRLLPHHASRTAQAEGAVKPRVGAVIEIGRVSNGQAFQPQSARAPPGRIRPGRRRE